ncbi:MAG: hypothetical protein IJ168_01975 [Eubacterium sp.]|nr:hypothetical protein [Eubacterium sp.]
MSVNNAGDIKVFNKSNLDHYLYEFAKTYRKLAGRKAPGIEIILIGGAAIIENYSFRNETLDVDALMTPSSIIKEAILKVAEMNNLPADWLNSDFVNTASYSPKLIQYSEYYKTFYGVLDVRSIRAEYLIAMKLCSGRRYKHDLSDVIGILLEHRRNHNDITYDMVDKAVNDLYNSWDKFPNGIQEQFRQIVESKELFSLFDQTKSGEASTKAFLLAFEEKYPGVLKSENVNEVIRDANNTSSLRKKLEALQAKQDAKPAGQTAQTVNKNDKVQE